jgi:hypothetical protein
MEATAEGDMQTVGKKGDEDVRLDARLVPVKDRPNGEIALEVAKRLLDAGELEVQGPQPRRIVIGEIGGQQVPARSTGSGRGKSRRANR